MKGVRVLLAVLGIALVVGVAFAGTALAEGPWGPHDPAQMGSGGEGVCENFVDLNEDGICDNRPADRPFLRGESEEWVAAREARRAEAMQRAADGEAMGRGLGRGRMARLGS